MFLITKYLYNGLAFKEYSGIVPTMVNLDVIPVKVNIPKTTWKLSYDYVKKDLKNYIEEALYENYNDLYLDPTIGPAFYIHKYIDLLSNVKYYMTYIHEYAFYQKPVNRQINYIEDGTNHVLDGGLVIPNDLDGTTVLELDFYPFPRKVFMPKNSLDVTHKANGLFGIRLELEDIAKPLDLANIFIIGKSHAGTSELC